jgi:uncharacterized protein YndB with AHSA1/START domain
MNTRFIAKASISINTDVTNVWDALTNPEIIKQYMFGTKVVTDWKQGSSIVWKGEWQGKSYEDKGRILAIEQNRILQYSHFSPLTGETDVPEHYHSVTVRLSDHGNSTDVSLSQDNNANDQEREHSEKNWNMMLTDMKNLLEKY